MCRTSEFKLVSEVDGTLFLIKLYINMYTYKLCVVE